MAIIILMVDHHPKKISTNFLILWIKLCNFDIMGKIIIEFDGEQHFKPINYFGGITNYEEIKKRDLIKNEFCEKNNIKLIRLDKTNLNDINEILSLEQRYTNK